MQICANLATRIIDYANLATPPIDYTNESIVMQIPYEFLYCNVPRVLIYYR